MLASAQTAATSPMPAITSERTGGARRRSPSLAFDRRADEGQDVPDEQRRAERQHEQREIVTEEFHWAPFRPGRPSGLVARGTTMMPASTTIAPPTSVVDRRDLTEEHPAAQHGRHRLDVGEHAEGGRRELIEQDEVERAQDRGEEDPEEHQPPPARRG